jgi:hypothetical protein
MQGRKAEIVRQRWRTGKLDPELVLRRAPVDMQDRRLWRAKLLSGNVKAAREE